MATDMYRKVEVNPQADLPLPHLAGPQRNRQCCTILQKGCMVSATGLDAEWNGQTIQFADCGLSI